MKQAEFVEKWLEALESGKYKQGKDVLVQGLADGKPKYCCLGVACQVANDLGIRKFDMQKLDDTCEGVLPVTFARMIGISTAGQFQVNVVHRGKEYIHLAQLNDAGVKFKTIAKIIREQIAAKNFLKIGR